MITFPMIRSGGEFDLATIPNEAVVDTHANWSLEALSSLPGRAAHLTLWNGELTADAIVALSNHTAAESLSLVNVHMTSEDVLLHLPQLAHTFSDIHLVDQNFHVPMPALKALHDGCERLHLRLDTMSSETLPMLATLGRLHTFCHLGGFETRELEALTKFASLKHLICTAPDSSSASSALRALPVSSLTFHGGHLSALATEGLYENRSIERLTFLGLSLTPSWIEGALNMEKIDSLTIGWPLPATERAPYPPGTPAPRVDAAFIAHFRKRALAEKDIDVIFVEKEARHIT